MRPPGRARRRPPARRAQSGGGTRRQRARNARRGLRGFLFRYRRVFFLFFLLGTIGVVGLLLLLTRVPLPPAAPQAETTFFTDVHGARLASLDAGENRVPVKLAAVPPVVVDAVLAVEDRKFFTHRGLDPFGIARATWADLRGKGSLQGGSTITQQYAKNAYVGRERSVWRKLKEIVVAVKLERKYDKRQILERYLNVIYFGRGAYGVQAASRAYFGKDVGALGLPEAAYLAGLIRAPERADFGRASAAATVRRDRTLVAMEASGMIDAATRRATEAIPLETYVATRRSQEPTVVQAAKGTQYFVEYVRRHLVQKYGEATVLGGGLRVKTTLDLRMQAQAYDAVYGFLDRAEDPAGALVAVDDRGAVRAMVGGRDWATSKVNLAVGREGGGQGRQAGSTFKPFLLAETVRRGWSLESSFPGPKKIVLPRANAGKDWPVSNFEDQDFGDSVNLIDATRNSVNTVYAQLAVKIGAVPMADMARDLGVTSPLQKVNSLVLGTSDVSVLEMARAFSTFGNRGERSDLHVLLEVATTDGNVLERARPTRTRVLDRDKADQVNFALRQAVERGTGTGARFGKPLIGKTGTTDDFGDAWFVGATPKLTAAVWMGYPEGASRAMTAVRGRKVTGGSFPATIFRRFMVAATKGVNTGSFPSVDDFPGKLLTGERIEFSPDGSTTTAPTTTSSTSSTTAPPSTTSTTRSTTTTTESTTTTTSTSTTSTSEPQSASGRKKEEGEPP